MERVPELESSGWVVVRFLIFTCVLLHSNVKLKQWASGFFLPRLLYNYFLFSKHYFQIVYPDYFSH